MNEKIRLSCGCRGCCRDSRVHRAYLCAVWVKYIVKYIALVPLTTRIACAACTPGTVQLAAVGGCLGLSSLFVGSLYLVGNGKHRDHPETIKRRIAATALATLASHVNRSSRSSRPCFSTWLASKIWI